MLSRHKKRFGVRLSIGLSATGITLTRTSGLFKKQSTLLAERTYSEDNLDQQLGSMLTEFQCDGLPVTVILSDTLVRIWIVTPPQNTVRLLDCQAAAAARFQALYGEPMSNWESAADWNPRHPFLACAMPHKLLHTLRQIAVEHQLALLAITPHLIASWNQWRADCTSAAWFGVLQDNALTIGAVQQQRLCAIRTVVVPDDAAHDKYWPAEQLKREALRLNLPVPAQLDLCGPVPVQWLNQATSAMRCTRLDGLVNSVAASAGEALARAGAQRSRAMFPLRIDFAPRTLRRVVAQTGPLTWLLGSAGGALCVLAVFIGLAQLEKNNTQKISLQKLEAQLAERTARKTPLKKSTIPDTQAFAVNSAILQLNLPWSDVLDAIEEATPPTVALLTLEPEAKKHIVKALAEAKSSGEMIAYIEQLKRQAFFDNVVITKHEVNEQDPNRPIRFQFEAQWKDATL